MTTPSLNDSWAKLRWAEHHFDVLRHEIDIFENRDTHTITVDVNPETGEYGFYITGLSEIPSSEWGLQIGDIVHNAWSALDYLVVQLWFLVTGESPREVTGLQFPLCVDPDQFTIKKATPTIKKLLDQPAFSGYLTRLAELQPFNANNPSVWGRHVMVGHHSMLLPGALSRLNDLNNVDKHRVIHAVWQGVAWHRSPSIEPPPGYRFTGGQTNGGSLKDDAEIGRWRFETPLPEPVWVPDEVTMKRHFPLEVCVDEPLPSKGVLEVLPYALWGAERVLRIFDPVFTHGSPPLQVTTALTAVEPPIEPPPPEPPRPPASAG